MEMKKDVALSSVSHISHPCLSNIGEALAARATNFILLLLFFVLNSLQLDSLIIKGDSNVVILVLQHS
jgi:hypothetical protein